RLTLLDGRHASSSEPVAPAEGARVADPLRLRSVFERHGGQFAVEASTATRGTRYVIDLPLRAVVPVDDTSRRQPAAALEASARRLAGVEILVVDDIADARETIQLALQ